LSVKGPTLSGRIQTFFRPPPQTQPGVKEVERLVRPGEFGDRRALVVGGSRGLGEVTAKILAVGGAEVRITYHRGEHDARRVVEEITRAGYRCSSQSLDVTAPSAEVAGTIAAAPSPTHLYYFATPRIEIRKAAPFSTERFEHLARYYVTGLESTVAGVIRSSNPSPVVVMNPSTVFLDAYESGTAEYCAAKGAGEELCRYLERRHSALTCVSPRLPRMRTDQTATIFHSTAPDPLDVLPQVIRDKVRVGHRS
jgi:NAD(P)-dependent dehydrogenase (short-subunit alcohol dehydrogenase family)